MNAATPLLAKGAAKHGDASIINVSSVLAEHPSPGGGLSIYSAAKAGLTVATRAAAAELAPKRIRVNTVSPGPIITNFIVAAGAPKEGECCVSGLVWRLSLHNTYSALRAQ